MLIHDTELAGRRVDVRIEGERIATIAAVGGAPDAVEVVFARGGALLPGLHDHHIHLMALAAAMRSVDCGAPHVRSATDLAELLRGAEVDRNGWIRGVGHHDSLGGPIDRERLGAWVPDRPVRVQHRSGALWILNGAGLAALGLTTGNDAPPGIERDDTGRPTGRIFREDAWLAERLGDGAPDLAAVGARLAAFGVTGATDATPRNDARALAHFTDAVTSGALPQQLRLMGTQALPPANTPRIARDAVKIWLSDAALPSFDELRDQIAAAHDAERSAAIHCVTRAELVLASAALAAAGARSGDRIEHAAVTPPDVLEALRALPLTIVTQPNFLHERGDAYAVEVELADRPWLYRCKGFLDAGLGLAGGTDAPFGDPDPWRAMQAAVLRRSTGSVTFAPEEALSPERALGLFTTPLEDPGGTPRAVQVGGIADLCLVDRPWSSAREALAETQVAATWCGGRLVWRRE